MTKTSIFRNKLSYIVTPFCITTLSGYAQVNSQSRYTLPDVPKAVGNYSLYKKSGNLVYINQVALKNGKIEHPGVIGIDVSENEAKEATRHWREGYSHTCHFWSLLNSAELSCRNPSYI